MAQELEISSEFLNTLEKADKKLKKLNETTDQLESTFSSLVNGGLAAFSQKLGEITNAIGNISKAKIGDLGIEKVTNDATKAADAVNTVVEAVDKIVVGDKTYSNSALNKINEEIQKTANELNELQKSFNFLTTGEGQSSLGLTSGTPLKKEANDLMGYIGILDSLEEDIKNKKTYLELLEEERRQIISNSQERIKADQVQSEIEKQKKASAKKANAEAKKSISDYQEELKRAERETRETREKLFALSEKNFPKNATYEGAMIYSKSTQSIAEQITAIKALKNAREKLNKSNLGEQEYNRQVKDLTNEINRQQKEVDRLTGKHQQLSNAHRGVMNTGEQLKRALTGMFSVSAISRYVKKLTQVRGEFELQQRALQAILQNKDEADKLWDKTVQLAIKSPFQIKELVTYTKQLAAYRIEVDKLYDTNKMLADISAGLGVDMQRLILAFGQVKAANYLRGTELRQFSEAGINILGELAKYFTELEGRAVSVGDVFERVSKRMVSFADVEEVLKRVTSEGGVFYNMQEIQAETLKGQISNLKDSVDVMLNDIGKSNEGVLKVFVKLTKSLVDNWRSIADYSIPVLSAMALKWTVVDGRIAKVVGSMGGLVKSLRLIRIYFKEGAEVAKSFANAMGTSLSKGFGSIATIAIAAIGALIVKLTEASREAKRLQKELDNIANEDKSNLNKSVRTFEDLVRRLAEVNVGSQEHSDIISKLNSQYGEYLGFLVDEKTTYDQLAGSIDRVASSMTQKAKANTLEKQYQTTYDTYSDDINKEEKWFSDLLASGRFYTLGEDGKELSFLPTKKEIESLFAFIKQKTIETGETINSWVDVTSLLSEFAKTDVYMQTGKAASFTHLEELTSMYLLISQAEDRLYQGIADVYGESESTREYREAMDKFMREIPQRQQYWANELFPTYDKDGKKIDTNLKDLAEPQLEAIQRKIDEEKYRLQFTYQLKPSGGSVDNAVNEAMKDWDSRQDVVKRANAQLTKVLGGKDKSILDAVYQERATAGQKNIGQIIDEYLAGYKGAEEELKRLNNLKKDGAVYSQEQTDEWQEQVNQQKELMNAYKEGLKAYGALDQLPENQKALEKLKNRAQLLEKMRNEYEKERKYRGEDDAAREVINSYEDAWVAVGGNIGEITRKMLGDGDLLAHYIETELLPLVELLPKKQREGATQFLTNIMGGFETHANDERLKQRQEDLKRQVEEYFDDYELSLELKKLNVSPDLAKQLFNFDTIDLKTLRQKLEAIKPQFVGTPLEEAHAQYLEKVKDMEDKATEERIKKYVQYLATAQSQRVKVEMDTLRQIKEVNEEANFSDAQKATIIAKIRQDAQKEIDKVQWEDFKNSEFYTLMFEDLESLGDQSIDLLRKQLEDLRGSLSHLDASEVKEIMSQLQKLKDLEIKRDPFASLRISREEVDALKEKGLTQEKLNADLLSNTQLQRDNQTEIDAMQLALNSKREEGIVLEGKALNYTKLTEKELEDNIEVLTRQNETLKDSQKTITENLQKYRNYYNSVQGSMERTKDYLDQANSVLSGTVALMDALGVPAEDVSRVIADAGINLVSAAQSAIQFEQQMQAVGYSSNMALGVIGWIAISIQTIASLIQTIANYNQGKLNAQIEGYQKNIDDLQKSYDKLEKSMDEAFNVQQLQQYNAEMKNNLLLQLEKAKAAKAAAEAGKDNKENQEKAKQYQDIIDEITASMEELDKNTKEAFSGGTFDSILSDAEAFVDAWLGAFEETGDGLSGLEEQFQETLKNIVKRQVALQFVGNYVQGWSNTLNSMFASGGELTPEEISDYAKKIKSEFPELSEKLEEFFKALGSTLDGTGSLSGLEKGIQGITEATAEVIASFLNSLRFYVADTNSRVANVERLIGGNEENNPMLAQLKIIATQTTAILDLLKGVRSNDGGYIKVELKES